MSAETSGIIVNAWEIQNDAQMILALAGHSNLDEIRSDRQMRAQQMVKLLSIDPSKTGFEIGSGTGIVANCLAKQCAALDCNDVSASFLEVARRECAQSPNVHFHLVTSGLSHLPSDSYDFGYSLNVFIHLNLFDMFQYFLDVERILKKDGLFFFDACTVADPTMEKFREHAELYRNNPAAVRGFLCFNDLHAIIRVAEEAGLVMGNAPVDQNEGWMKIIVRKPQSRPKARPR